MSEIDIRGTGTKIVGAPQYQSLLAIHGMDGKVLVEIAPDATVTVHEAGKEPEAAKVFWDAIRVQGRSYVGEIARLDARVKQLEAALAGTLGDGG